MSLRLKLTVACALFIALLSAPLLDSAQVMPVKPEAVPVYRPKYFPFEGGEKALYRASWNGMFSVATAEIFTTPTVVDGRQLFNVRVEAKTSTALDLIWKMRDTIVSTFDAKALIPSRYSFHQRENSRVIKTEARYSESTRRWAVNRQQAGKPAKIWEFDSQNTFDPLTAVYLARTLDFKPGERLYFKVFGGRYQYLLEMHVERQERVTFGSGKTVEAFRIIPRLQNITKGGYAERMNEAVIWLSADERRMPVKLSSKIAFGKVDLELIEDAHAAQSKTNATSPPAS
jgi:Protein of unknown function (DUF3108)